MTGNVVRVFSGKDRWVYGVALHQLSEKDYLAYLQIIYDGFNQSLPVLRDPWMTFFDSLFENLGKHLLQAKQKPLPPQRPAHVGKNRRGRDADPSKLTDQ